MVFGTIVENIKSFFQREEDLEHEPRKAPDAAVELYEKPLGKHTIVAHKMQGPLPRQPSKPKPLPFSSAEIRERLTSAQGVAGTPKIAGPKPSPPVRSTVQGAAESPAGRDAQYTVEDISSQIAEFEQAIDTIPGEDGSTIPLSRPSTGPAAAAKPRPQNAKGYFHEAAHTLRRPDLVPEEVLAQMKEHHANRLAQERRAAETDELERSFAHLMAELQGLERDWATKQEEIETSTERMAELEREIVEKSAELKRLAASLQAHGEGAPTSPSPSSHAPVPSSQDPSPANSSLADSPSGSSGSGAPSSDPASPSPSSSQLSSTPALPQDLAEPMGVPPSPQEAQQSQSGSVASPLAIAPSQRFFLADGRTLSSLAELRDALLVMDDALFYRHVTPERNDFAAWIAGVFARQDLAERARHVRSKYELARLLE